MLFVAVVLSLGCSSGFSLISGACTCSTGYVTGTGTEAVCHPCSTHANCSGGNIISCQSGYYDATCESTCLGVVSGSWPNATCAPCSGSTPYWDGTSNSCAACPDHANCSGGNIISCQSGYYDATCGSTCNGVVSGWPPGTCTPCSGVTPYWDSTSNSCAACPDHANCGGGTIINCQSGYYGATCGSTCRGVLSGSWPAGICTPCSGSTPYWDGTSCAACPAHANCSGGAIINCQNGYYGATCGSRCRGVLSGSWPAGICTPCSGSTPYWDSTSCAACPANATSCSDGAISSCQSGYYGATCESKCLGVVSYGSWPATTCTPCSGSTYWNGTSCVECPINTVCSGGAITRCANGFSGSNCDQCSSGTPWGGPSCACVCARDYSSAVTNCRYRRSQGMDGDWGIRASAPYTWTSCSQGCQASNHGPGGRGCYTNTVPYSCTDAPYCSDGYSHWGGTPGVIWIK